MAQTLDKNSSPSRIWLLSVPRSGSHLLTKMLSRQSKFSYSGYSFSEYIFTHHKLLDENVTLDKLPIVERDELLRAAKEGLSRTRLIVDKAEADGKIPLIKEHLSSIMDPFLTLQLMPGAENYVPWKTLLSEKALNPTLLPDNYLSTFKPVILIRHPALAYPSLYRATRAMLPHITIDSKGMSINFTLAWMRMTYNWLEQSAAASGTCKPIVLDADDIMLDRAVVHQLVLALGGDPNELIFNWNAVQGTELEDVQPFARVFESTLLASQGVLKTKTSANLEIEREAEAWANEFGKEVADKLRTYVENAMEDYEYLKAQRLT